MKALKSIRKKVKNIIKFLMNDVENTVRMVDWGKFIKILKIIYKEGLNFLKIIYKYPYKLILLSILLICGSILTIQDIYFIYGYIFSIIVLILVMDEE